MMMFLLIVVISAVYEPAIPGEKLYVSDQVKTLFYIMNLGVASTVVFAASAWAFKTIQFERSRSNILLQKIKTLFGQHVSTEVANELISNTHNIAESKPYEVTIMFLDIRDFTAYAEVRSPKEVANIQNTLFSEYITIVKDNKGIVLQILGDGLMAVFGAPIVTPSHPKDAIQAGHTMLEITNLLFESGQIPKMKLGIGLHTGKVIAGEIGNDSRKFYSITGTNVIIAARIEQLNKLLESQFLISETVFQRIQEADFASQSKGSFELKGISEKINIYQLA
jgi:class 3 adenylate cyclase